MLRRGTNGADEIDFRASSQSLVYEGANGSDRITGSRFADVLDGGAGDDRIRGLAGNDLILGGAGHDEIEGGQGLDFVTGGSGNDRFVFRQGDFQAAGIGPLASLALDTVLDFEGAGRAGGDVIRLEGFGAGTSIGFAGYGLLPSIQFYRIQDPTDATAGGLLRVVMADGTRKLGADDVVVVVNNQAPTGILLDDASIQENAAAGSVVGRLQGVDADAGDLLALTLVADAGGRFQIEDGALIATAPFDFETSPGFDVTVRATDRAGLSVERSFRIVVGDVDEAVTAGADRYGATEDQVLVVAAAQGVLANDLAPDGGAAVLSGSFATEQGGRVELATDGSFTYRPAADFAGTDRFGYTLTDRNGSTATGTAELVLAGVDDAPRFAQAGYTLEVDENLSVGGEVGVVAATEVDGQALAYAFGAQGLPFAIDALGRITLTAALDFDARDRFETALQASDGALVATTNLAVVVRDVDKPVTANADRYDAIEDRRLVVTAANGVLANDLAPDGGKEAVAGSITTVLGGTVLLSSDGSFTYTPSANSFGADRFSYTVQDQDGSQAMGSVAIDVAGRYDVVEDTVLQVGAAEGVLADDAGATITAGTIATARGGSVALAADGSFIYTPKPNAFGEDSFAFELKRADGSLDTLTAGIDITAVEDGPLVAPRTVDTGTSQDVFTGRFTASDPDYDFVTFVPISSRILTVESDGDYRLDLTDLSSPYELIVSVADPEGNQIGSFLAFAGAPIF